MDGLVVGYAVFGDAFGMIGIAIGREGGTRYSRYGAYEGMG